MRVLFIVFVVLIVNVFGASKHISWEESLAVATTKSQKTNKPILLMVTYVNCPECRYMDKVVFKKDKINSYINTNFIPVAFEFDDPKLPEKFKQFGIPRFYFSDDKLNVYKKHLGGMRTKQLDSLLKEQLEAYKTAKQEG